MTGTNGKTSTTRMTAAALGCLARPVAAATTVGTYLDDERLDLPATYGGYLSAMGACLSRGGRFAVAEMTSEALALGFAQAWPCRVGVFTNLTRDHLDSHQTAEHYLASKAQLFTHLPCGGAAVLNACDGSSALLAEVIPAGVRVLRYGVPSRGAPVAPLDVAALAVTLSWEGTVIDLAGQGLPERLEVRPIGHVFAENALAALCAAMASGVDPALAATAIGAASPPSGRFEVLGRRPYVVVDFAHTPDALMRTLVTARELCGGTLTVVFGAGGDRDRAKRPLMGGAAAAADRIILTTDNPRRESPAAIAAGIRSGIPGSSSVRTILDRAEAIRVAVREAEDDDVVVIAGRGHETEQTIGDRRVPFCDQEVVRQALGTRAVRRSPASGRGAWAGEPLPNPKPIGARGGRSA